MDGGGHLYFTDRKTDMITVELLSDLEREFGDRFGADRDRRI
jgi:hypothetical protein